jgi:hypothetical protein
MLHRVLGDLLKRKWLQSGETGTAWCSLRPYRLNRDVWSRLKENTFFKSCTRVTWKVYDLMIKLGHSAWEIIDCFKHFETSFRNDTTIIKENISVKWFHLLSNPNICLSPWFFTKTCVAHGTLFCKHLNDIHMTITDQNESTDLPMKHVAPQGSVLVPSLFII